MCRLCHNLYREARSTDFLARQYEKTHGVTPVRRVFGHAFFRPAGSLDGLNGHPAKDYDAIVNKLSMNYQTKYLQTYRTEGLDAYSIIKQSRTFIQTNHLVDKICGAPQSLSVAWKNCSVDVQQKQPQPLP